MGLFGSIIKSVQIVASGGSVSDAVNEVGAGVSSVVTDPLSNLKEAAGAGIAAGLAPLSATAWAAGAATEALGNVTGNEDIADVGRTARNAVADVNAAAVNDPLSAAMAAAGGALLVTGVGAPIGGALLTKGGGALFGGAMEDRASQTNAGAVADGAGGGQTQTEGAATTQPTSGVGSPRKRFFEVATHPKATAAQVRAVALPSMGQQVIARQNRWPGLWPLVRDYVKGLVRR